MITITEYTIDRNCITAFTQVPDPEWQFTDATGRVHRWHQQADSTWWLPTLEIREVEYEIPECELLYHEEYYVAATGELVVPRYKDRTENIPWPISLSGRYESDVALECGSEYDFRYCIFSAYTLPCDGRFIVVEGLAEYDGCGGLRHSGGWVSNGEITFKENADE